MRTKSVRSVMWVFLCERELVWVQRWPDRRDCIFNIHCRPFLQIKYLINRLQRSPKCLSVTCPCSCTVSVMPCRMVGIQSCLLNCICTKNRRPPYQTSSPASQPESRPATKRRLTNAALFFSCLFLLTSFSALSWFPIDYILIWTLIERSLILPYSISKHKPQTNHNL